MKIIDTHTHIYAEDFDMDIDAVIDRAMKAGVENILLPNIDASSLDAVHGLADAYPGYCIPMMGMHPTSVDQNWEENLRILEAQFSKRKYIAIGEVGIDLYWDLTFQEEQTLAFEEQLRWSIKYDLPVSIHSRNSTKETIASIKNVGADKLRGVFHSFSTTQEDMEDILNLGNFKLGINGVVTFRNSTLPAFLAQAALSNIIIETDAPYLTPAPYRGKRNEPSYTTHIVERLATIYGLSAQEVGEITTQNAKELFALDAWQ